MHQIEDFQVNILPGGNNTGKGGVVFASTYIVSLSVLRMCMPPVFKQRVCVCGGGGSDGGCHGEERA